VIEEGLVTFFRQEVPGSGNVILDREGLRYVEVIPTV
jgi:hypothetical protein